MKIDAEYTEEITCPYCGYAPGDSWERADSDRDYCENCDKEFFYERNVAVTYSSQKIEECE
ncbi:MULTISPECIES: hypothetical protein [unclassified Exiguobacterium]|uniref:hypothetical protein n=1 Tax=unclassified Exiguobacterium TaxID=2644629 RepID=UPI0013575CE9|nr:MULTISPECIES: hypothetical protein [unclassified Exiguobacterium]